MSSHQAAPDAVQRDGLVKDHGYLVEREASRYRTWHIDQADLRQAGILGLLIAAARAALARMDPRRADALILRYGLDDQPARSYRQIGRHLGVSDHTARNLVERAQADLRQLLT